MRERRLKRLSKEEKRVEVLDKAQIKSPTES